RIEDEVGRLLAGCGARVRHALADRAGDLLIEADAGDAVAALREGIEVRPAECSRAGRAGVPELAAPDDAQRCRRSNGDPHVGAERRVLESAVRHTVMAVEAGRRQAAFERSCLASRA